MGLKLIQQNPSLWRALFLWCVLSAFFLLPAVYGQEIGNIERVRLGESVPETFFKINHKAYHISDERDTVISFSTFEDKLIIIDFYAYWCGPCIYSVNKFNDMLKDHPDDEYVVVPVTSYSVEESRRLFDKYRWSLTTVVEDRMLEQFFPHRSIPHQVWIKDGKVIAMPIHTYATRENILKAINGDTFKVFDKIQDEKIQMSKAFDIQLERQLPLYVEGNGRLYGRLDGFQWANPTFGNRNDSTFYYFVNIPLAQILIEAYADTLFSLEAQLSNRGIDWKINEMLCKRFVVKPDTSGLNTYAKDSLLHEWRKGSRFSYFNSEPFYIDEHGQRMALQETLNKMLSTTFGIRASVARSEPKTFVRLYRLKPTEDVKRKLKEGLKTGRDWQGERDGIVSQKDVPFSQHFMGRLAESLYAIPNHDFSYPVNMVLDETGIEKNFRCYFEFPKAMWGDFAKINNELSRYGLAIEKITSRVPIIVVTSVSEY